VAIKSFRDILAYQNAVKALPQTNKAIENFSVHDKRWLANQIRSAAHSVPANIAEGYGHKDNENDFKRYLRIAMGSCNEVIARLETALKSGYIDPDTCTVLVEQWTVVGKQLNKLIRNWRTF
jgi:four helix bundle protein